MTDDCFDEAFDRYLAGRPVAAEAAAVGAFCDDVRSVAARPGRPGPQLARLLSDGLLRRSEATVAGSVPSPRSAQPSGRVRRCTVLGALTAAAAALTSVGAVAQAAMGVGVVVARSDRSSSGRRPSGPGPGRGVFRPGGGDAVRAAHSAPDTSTTDEEPAPREGVAGETGQAPAGEVSTGLPAQAGLGGQVSDGVQRDGGVGRADRGRAGETYRPEVPASPTAQRRRPQTAVTAGQIIGDRRRRPVPARRSRRRTGSTGVPDPRPGRCSTSPTPSAAGRGQCDGVDAQSELTSCPSVAQPFARVATSDRALPLRIGRRPLGSLTVGWEEAQSLDDDDRRVLDAFTAQCSQGQSRRPTGRRNGDRHEPRPVSPRASSDPC